VVTPKISDEKAQVCVQTDVLGAFAQQDLMLDTAILSPDGKQVVGRKRLCNRAYCSSAAGSGTALALGSEHARAVYSDHKACSYLSIREKSS